MTGPRLVAMVLVMTLAGGAQACLALCAAPAKPAQTAAATPEKSSCHRCPEKAPTNPTPEPSAPCKHCQTAGQAQRAVERDHSTFKAAFELDSLPFAELTSDAPAVGHSFEVVPPRVHSPPGERLHQLCLLLI